MLDPFLNYSMHKLDRESDAVNEERVAQYYGRPIEDARMPGLLALWVGNLMIRIGKKLTREGLPAHSAERTA